MIEYNVDRTARGRGDELDDDEAAAARVPIPIPDVPPRVDPECGAARGPAVMP